MPFEAHQLFPTPPDDAVIWRYVDLSKLLHLVQSNLLFFPSLTTLGKKDRFEGSLSSDELVMENLPLDILARMLHGNASVGDKELASAKGLQQLIREQRGWGPKHVATTFCSCWHMGHQESAAMWSLYCPGGSGIAIKSTVGRLKRALQNHSIDMIFVSAVRYIDYNKESIHPTGAAIMFSRAFAKRKSYEHEHELRAVISRLPAGWLGGDHPDLAPLTMAEPFPDGIYVPTETETLIETIHVAPGTPDWSFETIRRAVFALKLKCDVLKSELDADPIF